MQQIFSSETVPTVWRVLPAFEALIKTWKEYAEMKDYKILHVGIKNGIKTFEKYFDWVVESLAEIVSICVCFFLYLAEL